MTSLAEVKNLSAEVTARALETEAGRSVPDDLVRKLGAAGVFRMFVAALRRRPAGRSDDRLRGGGGVVAGRRFDRVDVDDPQHHLVQLLARARR